MTVELNFEQPFVSCFNVFPFYFITFLYISFNFNIIIMLRHELDLDLFLQLDSQICHSARSGRCVASCHISSGKLGMVRGVV